MDGRSLRSLLEFIGIYYSLLRMCPCTNTTKSNDDAHKHNTKDGDDARDREQLNRCKYIVLTRLRSDDVEYLIAMMEFGPDISGQPAPIYGHGCPKISGPKSTIAMRYS